MRKILFIIIAFTVMYSCKKPSSCTGLIFHQVKIVDSLNKAVVLDKFYTIDIAHSDTLHIKKYYTDSIQYYPLIDDRYSSAFEKDKPADFKFVGFKGNDTIISPYIFTFDGCHISLINGVTKIVY